MPEGVDLDEFSKFLAMIMAAAQQGTTRAAVGERRGEKQETSIRGGIVEVSGPPWDVGSGVSVELVVLKAQWR